MQFFVVANDKQAGAEEPPYNDREETTNLRVFDITLEDVNTVAKWKVKANELDWDTPDDLLMKPLVQADYEAMKPAAVNMSDVWETKTFKMEVDGEEKEVTKATIKPAIQKGEQCHQAGYLLVQPKGDYKVTLSILAPTGDDADAGDAVPMTQTTTLDIPTVFKAGFRYKVYIQLNALQEVNIHAELKDWEDYKDDIDIPVE